MFYVYEIAKLTGLTVQFGVIILLYMEMLLLWQYNGYVLLYYM